MEATASTKPKLMIVGHGEHGKDTVCEMLRDYHHFAFKSSSLHCAEIVFEVLGKKYWYETVQDCYADRRNHRKEWFDVITNYNTPDRTKIAREIYSEVDVYAGMRNREEFSQCKEQKVFDYAVWVDASKRLGTVEGQDSNQITKQDCDFVIDNNHSLEYLKNQVHVFDKMLHLLDLFKVGSILKPTGL